MKNDLTATLWGKMDKSHKYNTELRKPGTK